MTQVENRHTGGSYKYLCVGFYKIWIENIHSNIKILCDVNGVNWLSIQTSYHMSPSLGELIQLDLVSLKRISIKFFR